MRFRKLRIAVTVLSLTACVLLIALWVRSYSKRDCLYGWSPRYVQIASENGAMSVLSMALYPKSKWRLISGSTHPTPQWYFRLSNNGTWFAIAIVPHWFLAVSIATLAILPWIHWSKRISLRTMLVTLTLIAVGLGGIAYLVG